MVEGELHVGGLLLLELKVAVALGAEVLRRRAPEEAAVVRAQPRGLAPVLSRHFSSPGIQETPTNLNLQSETPIEIRINTAQQSNTSRSADLRNRSTTDTREKTEKKNTITTSISCREDSFKDDERYR